MPRPDKSVSWPDEFLDGLTALPPSKMTFSLTPVTDSKSFQGTIKIRNALVWDKKHPISVWRARASGRSYIIKKFCPPSDGDIRGMLRTFPEAFTDPTADTEQIRQDMDPFVLEQRAYDTIHSLASEASKAFFPSYYGNIQGERALVIELLRPSPSLKSRCLCSSSVPSYLTAELRSLREDDVYNTLSSLEISWYESLFVDRLKRLTALHSVGISHGDIKEDHFQLPGDFHDTVLFDFSHSYTITRQRPLLVQGYVIDSRYSRRWATWRSLEKLVKLERDWVRSLIKRRIENNDFRVRYGQMNEDNGEQELIVMRIFREPEELGFPSLASILPFLEAASPNHSKSWAISRAGSLEGYVALWTRSYHSNHSVCLLTMVAYSGETLRTWTSATSPDGKYHLILLPKVWLAEGLLISEEFVFGILSAQSNSREAWTVNRSDMHVDVNSARLD